MNPWFRMNEWQKGGSSRSAPTINILVTYGALQVFILYCIVLYLITSVKALKESLHIFLDNGTEDTA